MSRTNQREEERILLHGDWGNELSLIVLSFVEQGEAGIGGRYIGTSIKSRFVTML
jgi:hypothetical protein